MATFEQVFELIDWNTVKWATTGALGSYLSSSVALTASTNVAFPGVDGGFSISAGEEILVKDETGVNLPYNGHYFLDVLGDGSNPWILRRVTSPENGLFDAGRGRTVKWMIQTGSVNARTEWSADPVATLGVSDLFIEKHSGIKGPNSPTSIGHVPVFADTVSNRLVTSSLSSTAVHQGNLHVSGNLFVAGTFTNLLFSLAVISASYTASLGEITKINPVGGAFSVKAPNSPALNNKFGMKNMTTSSNVVTLDFSEDGVDGSTELTMNGASEWRTFQFDGATWAEVGG